MQLLSAAKENNSLLEEKSETAWKEVKKVSKILKLFYK